MDKATVRRVKGGYIVEVRWPLGGKVTGNGEVVCKTFDEAVTLLYEHLHVKEGECLKVGETIVVSKAGRDKVSLVETERSIEGILYCE